MEALLKQGKALVAAGDTREAIRLLTPARRAEGSNFRGERRDELLTLLGNAYRKEDNWEEAIGCYLEAMELNPHSPAAVHYRIAMDILEFRNKDLFNQ